MGQCQTPGEIHQITDMKPASMQAGLRDLAQKWGAADERFWSYQEIIASLERPEIVAYFVTAAPTVTLSPTSWKAFLLAEVGPFSTDLLYIYVTPESRRSGLGRALLTHLMTDLQKKPAQEALFLEVRVSNQAAQQLYKDMGMSQIGQRRAYYSNGEDALVFKKEFSSRLP
jgi:ribosomal-protein-alanine acetyltransferase